MRAGHSRTDITPGRDCPLLGYDQRTEFFPDGGNAGAHDPLCADALVIEAGGVRAVLVTLDLCIIETALADRLRSVVGEAADCPPDAVILACSHAHSGPYPHRAGEPATEPVPDILHGPASRAYAEFLERAVEQVAAAAAADLRPARATSHTSKLGLGYIRRVIQPDGGVGMAWNLREWQGPAPDPADDPAFAVLVLKRADGPDIVLWNAAAHPVVLGKTSNVVSADWPGAVRAAVESPTRRIMFLHGAGGDVHPWLATGDDPGDLDVVAAPAAALLRLLLALPGRAAEEPVIQFSRSGPCTALRLGPTRIIAFPCELFGATGAALRAEFPGLMIATTANGWMGYVPPAEAFAEGGYEIDAARAAGTTPGDCEALIAHARRALSTL